MTRPEILNSDDNEALSAAIDAAMRAIPPVWPLSASVAVNPYLGQTGMTLAEAGARIASVAGAPITMPRRWYGDRIAAGEISDDDLAAALASAADKPKPADIGALKRAAAGERRVHEALPTIADLAAQASGIDWPRLIAERFGAWAAGYLDQGQALWGAPQGGGAYRAWRAVAIRDLTPEIAGLKGFAQHAFEAAQRPEEALAGAVRTLKLADQAQELYLHRLLMTLGGWAQYARYLLWDAELKGGTDTTLRDFLAIRLIWEEALFARYGEAIAEDWASAREAYAAPRTPDADLVTDAILQEAAERADQRALAQTLAGPVPATRDQRPALHAIFCIDVRSERFRRALEAVAPGIRTSGFAGFFGIATQHRQFASDTAEHRLPVLLNPGVHSHAGGPDDTEADQEKRFYKRAVRAWGRFKLAAVSSFAFVEATGPIYIAKLVRDALGLQPSGYPDDPPPRLDTELDAEARADTAKTILSAMSLTRDFAPVVLLAGHGANVVNNPHTSALHCGACGGYSGEANARLLAALLNDCATREGLAERGIQIPEDTLFLGALHDTTTDEVVLYDGDHPSPGHRDALRQARRWLASAGKVTRAERALRLPHAGGETDVVRRSRDWAEIRPEWALAGCRAFIAAPRTRTAGRSLEGRAFLHDYDWKNDKNFGVLELIMTAPVVVASWISLQYYGSTVSPDVFGAGNKLLHNVTGGIGVAEGNGGPLRVGLPWQSVHDGEKLVHEPLRLAVCIEAPREAMSEILERHDVVRALFDNRWLHLFALDETGRMAWRYSGDLGWTDVEGAMSDREEQRAAG